VGMGASLRRLRGAVPPIGPAVRRSARSI